MNLQKTIEARAAEFAAAIIEALRTASLEDLVTITSGAAASRVAGRVASRSKALPKTSKKAGRLGRRTASDITRTLDNIVAVLGAHPEGMRAEQIKEALGLDKREMPRPIAQGLKSGALKKSGQKRATVYTVGSGAPKKARALRK